MSRQSTFGIGFVCLILCAAAPQRTNALDIVRDGRPAATIVVPRHSDDPLMRKWTMKPAKWLRNYIKQSTGAELQIQDEGQPVKGNIISLGHTKLSQAAGISLDGLKWDGCRIVVKGNVLYLIGRDEIGPKDRDFLGAKGTCKAAVTFLADCLGIKWYLPSPMGEMVPKKTDVAVPSPLDKTVQPKMAFFHGPYLYGIGTPASFANNMRTAVKMYTCAGHTWQPFLSAEEYFKKHPEYFALIRSQRTPGPRYDLNSYYLSIYGSLILPQAFDPGAYRNYLCTSNPEVKQILLQEVRKRFNEGYDWVQLGQADGYMRCECAACEVLDNYRGWPPKNDLGENPCERIHLLHKAIIDECRKSHPDKTIHLLAYAPTMSPSKKFDRYGDNVAVELASDTYLPQWRGKARALSEYVYWWCFGAPQSPGPRCGCPEVASEMRRFHKNGVVGVYLCGGGDCWGLEGPAYYLAGQLVDTPDLDWRDCLQEYCRFVYGEAGDSMVSFFTALYARKQRNLKDLYNLYAEDAAPVRAPSTLTPYGCHLANYPPAVIEQLERLLSRAEGEARSERAKGWLRLTRDYFDLTKARAEAYECYRLYKLQGNPSNFRRLEEAVNRWKSVKDRLLGYGKDSGYVATWFPGWVHVEKYFESIDREPRDWQKTTRFLWRRLPGEIFTEELRKVVKGSPEGRL